MEEDKMDAQHGASRVAAWARSVGPWDAIRISTAGAIIATLLVSRRLFFANEYFGPDPIWDGQALPGAVLVGWFGAVLLSCAATMVFRSPVATMVTCLLLVSRCVWDRTTWQPFLLMYVVVLACCAIASITPSRASNTAIWARLMVCGLYAWSGVSKLDHAFAHEGVRNHLAPFAEWLPVESLVGWGWVAAVVEVSMALALVARRTRRVGIAAALLMHVVILVVSVFGLSSNPVIWPWNLQMLVLVPALFAGRWLDGSTARLLEALAEVVRQSCARSCGYFPFRDRAWPLLVWRLEPLALIPAL